MPSFHPAWYEACTTTFLGVVEMWRYCHWQKNVVAMKCCYQRSCQRFFQVTLRFGAVVLQWLLWCGDHLFYVIVAPKRFVFSMSYTLCFALCFSTIINSPCHIVLHFMQWPNLSLGAPHFVVAYVILVDFSHRANGFGGVCNWLNDHFVWCDLEALCLKLILFSLFISPSLTQPSTSSIHKVDIIVQVQLLLPCYWPIIILLNVKKTLTLYFSYLLCYCILGSFFFCCMFETISFGKQQTLLTISMIIWGG